MGIGLSVIRGLDPQGTSANSSTGEAASKSVVPQRMAISEAWHDAPREKAQFLGGVARSAWSCRCPADGDNGQISDHARRHPLGVGGCRHNSVDWRGVSFGSPLCVAVKRLVAKGAANLCERHCHHNVTLPSRRAARHVKAPDGTSNGHAPPYAAIPMPGGIPLLHVPLAERAE